MTLLLVFAAVATAAAQPADARVSATTCGSTACSLDLAGAGSVDVAGFSFGASNSAATGGLSNAKRQPRPAGKVSVSDISMTKRTAPSSSEGPASVCSASAPCPGGGTVSLSLSSSRKGWDGCVKGSHIPEAHLRSSAGTVHLSDVTVERCDDGAGQVVLRYASASQMTPATPVSR